MVPPHLSAGAPEDGAPGGPLVVLVGPTGSGKTAVALGLCERLHASIVNCDSMQVYRGLDIGTAKPTASERARAPHHLLDVVEPHEAFDAGQFVRAADAAIAAERARGRLPLVVGGTGLYVRALLRGLAEVPPVPAKVREALARELEERGLPALHARLAEVDPELAARLPPADRQRILRGLEVFDALGVPLSHLQRAHAFQGRRYEALLLALDVPRERLYLRLDGRVVEMIEAGLVDEVRGLLEAGVPSDARALGAPGYREVVASLQGRLDPRALVGEIQKAHRRYAKRQITWFRKEPGVEWTPPDLDRIEPRIRDFLQRG